MNEPWAVIALIEFGCLVVAAYVYLTTPQKCPHPCGQCGAERADAELRAKQQEAEAEERGTTYNHDQGLDRRWCVLCKHIHCAHEGCQRFSE